MTADKPSTQEDELAEFPKLDVAASPASALQKEIASFSQLASEAASAFVTRESIQEALQFLSECPFSGTPRRVPGANRSTSRPPDVLPISHGNASSVTELRSLAKRWRRAGGKSRQESDFLGRLEQFLKDLQYQRRLYIFFLRRIYAPLYRSFFILPTEGEEEEKMKEEEGGAFFLTECEIPTEEEEKEKVTEQLAALEARWRRIFEENQILSAELFEERGEKEEEGHLDLVLRLLPDLSAKCRLGARLAGQWLSEHKERHPEQKERESGRLKSPEEDLKLLRKALLKKEGEMRRGEHAVTIFEAELETLKAREERVLALCSNCSQLQRHRESLSEKYSQLLSERQRLTKEIEETIQGTQRLRELSRQLKDLELDITNQYGELQMVEYALNIASNDYDLHMSLQPSFYAFSRTASDKLARAKVENQRRKGQYAILQKRYDRARGLIAQMRHVEAACGDGNQEETARPATNETYTKFRVTDRYSDAGQRSDSSVSGGGSGNDADSEVSDAVPASSPPPFPRRAPVHGLNHTNPLSETAAQEN